MITYIIRRLLLFVPTLIGVTLLVFILMRMIPGDIAEIMVMAEDGDTGPAVQEEIAQIRKQLGLDRPYWVQYLSWVGSLLQGDFEFSYWEQRPVSEIIGERFPISMELALLTITMAILWAVPIGVISAVRQDTWVDNVGRLVSISGLSLPLFLTGILILYVLIRFFQYLPPLEFANFFEDPGRNLSQLIWPALAQAFYIAAPITRLTRSQMLDVIREDYVRTARSKGLSERVVIYGHALRNALLPVVTFIGWWGGRLLGGVVIMEVIFGIPGMGSGLIDAVSNRDYTTVQAIAMLMVFVFLVINLVVDLSYGWMDPRIRYE